MAVRGNDGGGDLTPAVDTHHAKRRTGGQRLAAQPGEARALRGGDIRRLVRPGGHGSRRRRDPATRQPQERIASSGDDLADGELRKDGIVLAVRIGRVAVQRRGDGVGRA